MLKIEVPNNTMKATRIYTLLALLLTVEGMTMQAQELNEIFWSPDSWVYSMMFEDEHTFVANRTIVDQYSNVAEIQFVRMTDEGEELASQQLFSREEYAEVVWQSPMQRLPNGGLAIFYAKRVDGIATFYRVNLNDDLTFSTLQLDWETDDYYDDDRTFYPYNTGVVVNKDSNVIITYPPHSQYHLNGTEAMQFLKFDAEGQLVGQRLMEGFRGQERHHTLPTPDSLGCRIILRSNGSPKLDCHTLDADLNTIVVKENVEELSWPYQCCRFAYLCTNPVNGKTYSNNIINYPAYGGNPAIVEDIMMSVFDAENFRQTNYAWGLTTQSHDGAGILQSVGFDDDNNVYMVGQMDNVMANEFLNRNLYIAYLDENLNKLGEIYHVDDYAYMVKSMAAYPEGGCLVSCHKIHEATNEAGNCLIKITKETLVGIEEAHDAGFAVAVAYPNPGKDVLNIRTGLKDAWVEVYDLNGRMIYGREITENVTAINTTDWSEGTYVWKVMADGKEVESGKWIKE
ncbi:MAG: T9SS type A sorting domain-containing protein [bacterium]|nr:T9SS type A sorting domain-containing protein [Candidatus Limimorpha caballi]